MANEPDSSNDGPLDRAIAILTFVAEQKKALSAAEIAAALSLPLPTAHRLIGNLENRGTIRFADRLPRSCPLRNNSPEPSGRRSTAPGNPHVPVNSPAISDLFDDFDGGGGHHGGGRITDDHT